MDFHNFVLKQQDFKAAFVEGNLVLDCAEIRLTQNAGESPATYCATGYIQVSPQHGAEARLVCMREEGDAFDPLASFKRAFEVYSGRIIPESHYFKLEAVDLGGNRWTHPSANVRFDECPKSVTLTITCDYLRCDFDYPNKRAWTEMVLVEELEFPMNVFDEAKQLVRGKSSSHLFEVGSSGVADNLTIVYDMRKGRAGAARFSELFAEPHDQGGIPPVGFEQRLLESARFVTAMLFWPVMIETCRDGRGVIEISKSRPAPRGEMIYPPLNVRGNHEDFYALLGCYYRYACREATGDQFAPLSKKLGGLFTLRGVWFDTVALVVSVAIESMLGDAAFDEVGPIDKQFLVQIDNIFAAVRALSDVDMKLRERAVGAMSRMKSTGTRDKLKALAAANALNSAAPDIWKKLRNTSAHGKLHIAPARLQEFLDNVFASVTIVYQLVFLRINYAGKFTDYSKHGWPEEYFDASACWKKLQEQAEPPTANTVDVHPDAASPSTPFEVSSAPEPPTPAG